MGLLTFIIILLVALPIVTVISIVTGAGVDAEDIVFSIICTAIFIFGVIKIKESDKKSLERGVIIADPLARYIGGFSDIEGGGNVFIEIMKNEIYLRFGAKGEKTIPMDIVTNAEIKSETQITQEIGLGKMVVFGALAFAMKKDKSTVMNYLVISCDDNGDKRDLIFQSDNAAKMVKEIRRIKGIESIF